MGQRTSPGQVTGHDVESLSVLWLALSVAVLAVGIPAAMVSSVEDVARSDAWPITVGITVWAGLRLSVLWARAAPLMFDFFFWVYVYIFLGIAPTVQIRSGQLSTTTPGMDPALDSPTAWVVVLGLLGYEVGRFAWSAVRDRREVAPPPELGIKPSRTMVLFGIALLGSAYYLSRIGLGAALGSREAATNAREAAWPDPAMRAIFQALAIYPMLVVVGALSQLRGRVVEAGNRRLATGLIVVAVVCLLAIVNPISSARYTLGTVLFALAVFAGATATVTRTRITMAVTLLGFIFVFPIADAFRRASGSNVTGRAGFFDEYLANPDYDSFWQIANALSFTIDGLVQPFQQVLGSIFFWVPRSLWPGKPIDTGAMLAQYRGYVVENLSAPAWAELLANAGIAGVVLGFIIFGCLLYEVDRRVGGSSRHGWWRIPQAILPVYMIILLRGSWLQATGALITMLACMLFVCSRGAPAETADLPEDDRVAAT